MKRRPSKPGRVELPILAALISIVLAFLVLQGWGRFELAKRKIGIYQRSSSHGGVIVDDVVVGEPAEAAGVRAGDRFLSIDGLAIEGLDDLGRLLSGKDRGQAVTFEIERAGELLRVDVVPGVSFPLLSFTVLVITVLGYLTIGPLAVRMRPGYLRARLLFFLTVAVAGELALPETGPRALLWLPLGVLLNGVQMGVELHLASVIPERQRWLQRVPWAIPVFYAVSVTLALMVAAALAVDGYSQVGAEGVGGRLYDIYTTWVFPVWAIGVVLLLGRQAWRYPEERGRQQAALVLAGVLPWVALMALDDVGLWQRWVPMHWQDGLWNVGLLCYPLAVFVILLRETANQERIVLDLTDEVQRVASVADISRLVASELHSAFHPKSTHVFYRERFSRDLTLGHSTAAHLHEEQIPESSALLRLVASYGKSLDYPEELVGLPPPEQAWLERLGTRLIVPLIGRDERLIGLLLLGEKKSEEPYTVRDRKLLQSLAVQIALVYENARLKESVDQVRRVQREVISQLAGEQLNLVKECPSCARCWDAAVARCPEDGAELYHSLPVERLIGQRYQLEQRIGRGGMGAIYVATDRHLGRPVAIKILVESLVVGEILRRFEREARVTASLSHPNIVTVFDYGTTDTGCAFLVMELLQGVTLGTLLLEEGALPVERVASILDQTFEGVKAAHRADVVHRDIKPANVFLAHQEDGSVVVKILDFGVAKVRSLALQDSVNLTTPGALVGTFSYMAPEQLSGKGVDARADLFAIAVVAVEALTGQRPFSGDSPAEILSSVLRESILLSVTSEPEAALDAILRRGLAKDPDGRFPSAAAMQAELIPAIRACGV